MSNNKQSSVEWYINNLIDILGDEICNKLTIEQTNKIHNLGNQAVSMHKEEIKMTAIKCHFEGTRQISKTSEEYIQYGEQYYNETFGGEQ